MKFKIFSALMLAFIFVISANAQEDKSKRTSPPATAKAEINGTSIVIDYSQPSVKGRTIFGDLVPYGKVWRTGANEATTFTINREIRVNGKTLAAGKYALFTIPGEKEWTIIFNSVSDQWGAYRYKESKDALRVSASPEKHAQTEKMTFTLDSKNNMVHLDWATTRVSFAIK